MVIPMERRVFKRSSVEMNGDLSWTTKGRFGRKQKQRAFVRTENLSLDGARIFLDGTLPFAVDATARLQLGIRYCDVRILEVLHQDDCTILRITFVTPSRSFVSILEEQLAINTGARGTVEGKWV